MIFQHGFDFRVPVWGRNAIYSWVRPLCGPLNIGVPARVTIGIFNGLLGGISSWDHLYNFVPVARMLERQTALCLSAASERSSCGAFKVSTLCSPGRRRLAMPVWPYVSLAPLCPADTALPTRSFFNVSSPIPCALEPMAPPDIYFTTQRSKASFRTVPFPLGIRSRTSCG